jgi:hypothetical protein
MSAAGFGGLRGAVLAAALLAGCTGGPGSKPAPAPVNLSGYSPTFKEGYAEGCESAASRAQRRNEGRYKTEADYMMGWNDGFSACRRR